MEFQLRTKLGIYTIEDHNIHLEDVFVTKSQILRSSYVVDIPNDDFIWAHYDLLPVSNGVIMRNYWLKRDTFTFQPFNMQITNLN